MANWKVSDDLASDIAAIEQPTEAMDASALHPYDSLSTYHHLRPRLTFSFLILQDSMSPSLRNGVSPDFEANQTGDQSTAQGPSSISSPTSGRSLSLSTFPTSHDLNNTPASNWETSEIRAITTNSVLYWQSQPPGYSGDIDIYIWQPYRKPPPFNYVKLHIVDDETSRNMKMLLLFNDSRSLCAFRTLHQELTKRRDTSEIWSPDVELVRSISAVVETMLLDMAEFLQYSSKEVTTLVRPAY